MNQSNVRVGDYVSFVVMLLMAFAFVAAQADAGGNPAKKALAAAPALLMDDRLNIDLKGNIGDKALEVSISVATDLSHFRGEDE